ncbi:MAG: diadenylate cyclase CdaA [Alloprevotella sp.]|nr:diadenylate cyclase CdaA [Alloprevotella sp.]MBR1652243.1 diadenylate cyclase CdaA [Alloprevotella sp.]
MLSFGFKDIIDILLVALLLYYLWRLMKDSSSSNLFSGILVFLVCWILVSRVFDMRLLGGIFNNLVSVGAVALVVLFQDDIRHFFSTIGSKRSTIFLRRFFQNGKQGEEYKADIMPIVLACMSMGKQKVGALIIVEHLDGLRDVIATGERINADISQRLIENIFFKNSPLHDGALVVSGHRLVAAGCLLPVSHDSDIPKSLGLRHRAALGISQKSDCLAIVVSEETGAISVAQNGQFRLRLSAEELESTLAALWAES